MQERLDHLESSCTSMAAELLEKSEIIQQYIGRTRTGDNFVMKIFNRLNFIAKLTTNCFIINAKIINFSIGTLLLIIFLCNSIYSTNS